MQWTRMLFAVAGLVVVLALVGGCVSDRERQFVNAEDVRGTTPSLATMVRSEGQLKNKEVRVINSYLRGLRTDISRALLLDHNTRLVPYPVP